MVKYRYIEKLNPIYFMNYDFYSDASGTLEILTCIFDETDLQVYELASDWGQEVREFKSVNDITLNLDLTNQRKSLLTYQLWSSRHGGRPIFKQVSLDPNRCDGQAFRYSTEGWGLIQ